MGFLVTAGERHSPYGEGGGKCYLSVFMHSLV